jgi:acetoin utilization deacetylase AcuC-like enzyme
MAQALLELANQHAGGRIVFLLEGGYATEAMAQSVIAILQVLKDHNFAD